jgi:hypothetical protein
LTELLRQVLVLNENDIVDAVCCYLSGADYAILQRCTTKEHGIDVIAKDIATGKRLLLEAKGGTSTREGSARFNLPFTRNQVFDRVSKCLYTTFRMLVNAHDQNAEVAMAFPDTPLFREHVEAIAPITTKLGLRIFMVAEDHSVKEI